MQIMHRRAHVRIGLVLLLTMGLSIAEAALASACSPAMGDTHDPVTGTRDLMVDMPAPHDCPPAHQDDPQNHRNNGFPCPFAPAGVAAGCTASAVLPGTIATLSPALAEMAVTSSHIETTPHVLRGISIFHPPKA